MSLNTVSVSSLNFHWYSNTDWTLNISCLDVKQNEKLFLQGPSGSGKTTLLDLLTGIHVPVQGTIKILETDIGSLTTTQRDRFRADHIGLIFQQFNLLPYLNVIDNVILPCFFSNKRKQKVENQGTLHEVASNMLVCLGLDEGLFHRQASLLSVGQQQRVAVARALIGQPELIIADEPTSALDQETRDVFIKLLLKSVADANSSIVFVSHDKGLAHYFDRQIDINSLANEDVEI
ncbi:MAG: ABC transporter ATP-binding protein [Proteobacteria bacterium]|nr:ABC transporter ATP-binding protein [Pseudomonadota bacterium]